MNKPEDKLILGKIEFNKFNDLMSKASNLYNDIKLLKRGCSPGILLESKLDNLLKIYKDLDSCTSYFRR